MQIPRFSQVDRDSASMKMGGNYSGFRFEGQVAGTAGKLLHKMRETAGAVAAHFTGTAIIVVKLPSPISLSRSARNQQDEPIGSDPAMTVTKAGNLFPAQFNLASAVIHEDKVIAGPIHFGEFHDHVRKVSVEGQSSSGKIRSLQAETRFAH
jgi:hypothetical protein